ncbi:MAG: hypothetical protein U0414_11875 [Polyangiaceae bacterium]
MANSKRRRFIDVLRRTANLGQGATRSALDDAALWDARDRAARGAIDAARLAERVTAGATRQRTQMDGAVERATALGARADAATLAAKQSVEAFERLSIVALNAGLEGARLPDNVGKPLLLLSDELKAQTNLGAENARRLLGVTTALNDDASDLSQRLDKLSKDWTETSGEAALLKTSAQDTTLALTELETRLRRATGLDPDLARSLSEAGDHAKGLVRALTALEARDMGDDRASVTEALVPVLTPLRKLLHALSESDAEPPPSDES